MCVCVPAVRMLTAQMGPWGLICCPLYHGVQGEHCWPPSRTNSSTSGPSTVGPAACCHPWTNRQTYTTTDLLQCMTVCMSPAGSQAHIEAQSSWVTALSWVQTSSPFLNQEACSQTNPPESLLVGRLNGSLCWLEVTEDLRVESTELTHCHRKEGAF